MSQDWDFYPLFVDSEPASIYLDLGLARVAPREHQPHMRYLRLFMRQPRPDGLSSNDEFDALGDLEDALVNGLTQDGSVTYAGRNTSGGNRDFYFYTAKAAAFDERAEEVMRAHPDYRFELGGRLDPEWRVYFDFLYPSTDDLQRILNRRVVNSLEEHGDTLSEPRRIDHLACLPDARTAQSLSNYLSEQGFTIEKPRIEGDALAISFWRVDRPDAIDEVVVPLARRSQQLGGEYDGWGCKVVS